MTCKQFFDRLKVIYCAPVLQITLRFLVWNPATVKNFSKLSFCLFHHPKRKTARVFLDKNQVLKVVMSVEKQVSCEKLWNYAANWPYVSQFIPLTTFENHFWRAILPGADDRAVKFVKFGGASKIDDSGLVRFWQINLFGLFGPAFKHE